MKNTNGTGTEIIEENNYYPFGLKHSGYNQLAGNTAYAYKYNGKELQETGMYDFGARIYSADAPHFWQHDPLSEKTLQPYAFGYGNPIRYNDPTGMEGEPVNDGGGGPELAPNALGGINNPHQIQEIVLTGISMAKQIDSSLSFMGIQSLNTYYSSENRLGEAINNCKACKETETFEKALFIGLPVVLATGGVGGFAMSGEVTVGSFLAKASTDAGIQTAAQFTTNGGNLGEAIGNINFTQSALAGIGMNYIGNSLISSAANINAIDSKSIFTGSIGAKEYATQAALGIAGGAVVNGVSGSSVFKNTVIGAYMRTTVSFGQTAGTAVGTLLMNSPDYGTSVIQNKITP